MVTGSQTLLGQYAGFITRAAALTIDIVIVSVVVILINWILSLPIDYFFNVDVSNCSQDSQVYGTYGQLICRLFNVTTFVVTLATAPIYFSLLISIGGQTVGKYIMGVRVVRIDGQRMNVGISFFRWLGYFVSVLLFGLGFLMVMVDNQRRALHDHLAGTCVIYSWRARQNEFMLDRLYRKFGIGGDAKPSRALPVLSSAYDIVAVAVPNYSRMQMMLNTLESAVSRGDIKVTNTAVVAKDRYGDLGVVGVSDLAVGSNDLSMIDSALNIPSAQLRQIEADVPADSFIIIVLLKDEYVDALTGQISRRSAAQVRVYDVGQRADSLTATDGKPLQAAKVTPKSK